MIFASGKHQREGYHHLSMHMNLCVMVFCRFELRLRIILSDGKLTLTPRLRNTDNKPFSFMFGLSNYLSVSDVRFAH